MTTQAITKYATTDIDVIRGEQEAMKKEREERAMREGRMKLVEGKNMLRVLPPKLGKRSPFHVTYIHYVRNPAQPDKAGRPVVCPLKTRNEPCVVCKKVSELRRSTAVDDQNLAREMSSGRRIFANVVNLNEADKGTQILEFGTKIYEDLLGILTDEEAGADFTHPESGYNLVIERVGTKKEDTRYTVRMARQPSAIAKKDWLDGMHDLGSVIQEMDTDRIRAVLEGRDPDAAPADARTEVGGPTADDDLYGPARGGK